MKRNETQTDLLNKLSEKVEEELVYENTNIKEWYMEEYPDDEVGATLNDDITFKTIINSALIVRYGAELFLITK